jgi:hypothetical protein
MTWSPAFIDRLRFANSLTFLFRLHFIPTAHGVGSELILDNTNPDIQIESSSVRINGTSITGQSFSSTFGSFSLRIVGDYRAISDSINRGQIAILYVGFSDISLGSYQRLIWGQLSNVRKINFETYEFVFDDALSSLNNRQDLRYDTVTTLHKSSLFYTLGQETTLTGNFNTNTDTNLPVTDVTKFERDSTGRGLMLIDDSVHATPFYAEWVSKTVTSSPAGYLVMRHTPTQKAYPTETAATIPTTLHSASTTVYNAGQITDFPPHIMGKVIQTGTGAILDDLPDSWGVGGDFPSDIYDYADAETQKVYIRASTAAAAVTYRWRIPLTGAITEFMRVLTQKANDLGQWPVLRQGRISWRGCDDPNETTIPNGLKPIAYNITDDDIISVSRHEFFDAHVRGLYGKIAIKYDENASIRTTTSTKKFNSLPAYTTADSRGDGLTYDNALDRRYLAEGDALRMQSYHRSISEKITLTMQLHMCRFVAGDNVTISSSILFGRDEAKGATYAQRAGMISGVDIDFGSRSCSVTILLLPKRSR